MLLVKLVSPGTDGPEEYGYQTEDYRITRFFALNEREWRAYQKREGIDACEHPFLEPNFPCTMRLIELYPRHRVIAAPQTTTDLYIMSSMGQTLDSYRAPR